MKSENGIAGDNRETKAPVQSNNYDNEMNSGTIGAEGEIDNGASTLRALRKKHAKTSHVKSPRKPML
jgi:hypothetical protein